MALLSAVGLVIFLLTMLRAKRKSTESASSRQSPAAESDGVVQ